MDKLKAHKLCAAAGVCLAAAFLALDVAALQCISALDDRVVRLQGQLAQADSTLVSLQSDLWGLEDRLREAAAREASLFSQAETGMALQDGELALTVSLVPKQVEPGDVLLLQAEGKQAALTSADGVHYTGAMRLPLKEEVTPVISVTGADGSARMEALDPLASWQWSQLDYETALGGENDFTVTLYPQEGQEPIVEGGRLTLRVADGVIGTEVGRVDLEPAADGTVYRCHADLSDCYDRPGEYELWLELDLGGVRFRDVNAAGSIQVSEDGLSQSTSFGGGTLRAVFP